MTKYDYDFKQKVVQAYLNGEGGYSSLAKKYGVPNLAQDQRWVKTYDSLGEHGLKPKNKKTYYSVQFKLEVINYMIRTKSSAQEVASHFKIKNSTLVSTWKCKFENGGIGTLSKIKETPSMNKNNKVKVLTREQKLEHENELLKAELAFFKKLRASGMSIPERLKTNTKRK
ncbi:transposase IS3/IS911 family protein [[Clostridium] sordellii]|uniref:helix-turn-helix domain-containing protein n=1 Tax=Paraclostridium sordellii TaxID=1505 RepID=UPI0005E5E7BB|nr:transposase IS3/IS911 family protein [[Clostridium] sordellii] [Paeniclostridium sordellii]